MLFRLARTVDTFAQAFLNVLFCSVQVCFVLFWSFLTLGPGPSSAPVLLPPVEGSLSERASISARQEMRLRQPQSPVVFRESRARRRVGVGSGVGGWMHICV